MQNITCTNGTDLYLHNFGLISIIPLYIETRRYDNTPVANRISK